MIKRVEIIEVPERFYMKVSDAARYIGISPNSLRKYTDLGLIQAKILPGGDRLYGKEWLDEFVANLPDAVRNQAGGIAGGEEHIIGPVRPVLESRKEETDGS